MSVCDWNVISLVYHQLATTCELKRLGIISDAVSVCAQISEFADKVIRHNPPLPGLLVHTLPVFNHTRTDHNTKPVMHQCIKLARSSCYCMTSSLCRRILNDDNGLNLQMSWRISFTQSKEKATIILINLQSLDTMWCITLVAYALPCDWPHIFSLATSTIAKWLSYTW